MNPKSNFLSFRLRSILLLLPSLALFLGPIANGFGQSFNWINTAGGSFNTAGNWNPAGPPGVTQNSLFNLPNTYTVSFNTSPTNANASFGGNVTFDLNGNAYSISNFMTVGINGSAVLNLVDGTLNTRLFLGSVVGATGNVNIGAGGILNGGANSLFGSFGTGNLNITSGGDYVGTGNLFVGSLATGAGNITISGTGSTMSNSGSVTLGDFGTGSMSVSNGGSFATSNLLLGGTGSASSGSLVTSGTGSTVTISNDLRVGDVGTGSVDIGIGSQVNAGTLDLRGTGQVNLNGGTLSIQSFNDSGGQLNFNNGQLAFTGFVDLSASALDSILGAGHNLGGGKTLAANGAMSVNGPLSINGGTLSATALANALINNSALQVTNGTLTTSGLFTNNANGVLNITGLATANFAGGISNSGTLRLDDNLVATTGGTLTNNGVVRGTGFIGNRLNNQVGGSVQLTAGNRLQFQGTNNTNAGVISLVGGEVQFTQVVTNVVSTGLISSRDAILRFDQGLTNDGAMGFTVGTSDVFGDVTNSSTGKIEVSGGGKVTFYEDLVQNGTLEIAKVGNVESIAVLFGEFSGPGGFTGGGNLFALGDLRPGASPASVLMDGNLFLGASTDTFIELGGLGIGAFDQLVVAGDLSLAGELFVSLINGHTLGLNETYLISDVGGSLQGSFAGLSEGSRVGTFGGSDLFVTYRAGNGHSVGLFTAVPEPMTNGLIMTVFLCGTFLRRRTTSCWSG